MSRPQPTPDDLFRLGQRDPLVRAWLAMWGSGTLPLEQALTGLVVALAERAEMYAKAVAKQTARVDGAVAAGTLKVEMPSLWPDDIGKTVPLDVAIGAVAAERERCAKLVEGCAESDTTGAIAALIREAA